MKVARDFKSLDKGLPTFCFSFSARRAGGHCRIVRPPGGEKNKGELGGLPTRDSSPWQNPSALRAAQTRAGFNSPRESTGTFYFWRYPFTPARSVPPRPLLHSTFDNRKSTIPRSSSVRFRSRLGSGPALALGVRISRSGVTRRGTDSGPRW